MTRPAHAPSAHLLLLAAAVLVAGGCRSKRAENAGTRSPGHRTSTATGSRAGHRATGSAEPRDVVIGQRSDDNGELSNNNNGLEVQYDDSGDDEEDGTGDTPPSPVALATADGPNLSTFTARTVALAGPADDPSAAPKVRDPALVKAILEAVGPNQPLRGGGASCRRGPWFDLLDSANEVIGVVVLCDEAGPEHSAPAQFDSPAHNKGWRIVVPDRNKLMALMAKHLGAPGE